MNNILCVRLNEYFSKNAKKHMLDAELTFLSSHEQTKKLNTIFLSNFIDQPLL